MTTSTRVERVADRTKHAGAELADVAVRAWGDVRDMTHRARKSAPRMTRKGKRMVRRGRRIARRTIKPRRAMGSMFIAGALGALVTYLFDPRQGSGRRAKIRDMAKGFGRRAGRGGARIVRHVASDVRGKARTVSHTHPADPAPNDPTLKHRIESEVLRHVDVGHDQVNVMVEDGTVLLHGQVPDRRKIRQLERACANVAGVRQVNSFLHTPDEPAQSAPGQSGNARIKHA